MKTETPISDKNKVRFSSLFAGDDAFWVHVSVSKKLETELNQLRAGIKHLQKMSASEMRLQLGDMTASEIRLVRAITNALLAMPNVES